MTILGIGPARSGTQSLAYLLQQWGLDVTHEGTTSVPWTLDWPVRYGRMQRELESLDGDVACWLTQAAPRLMEEFPEAKCLALRRPKQDCVDSLHDALGAQRIRADKPFGSMCFPTYDDRSIREGWEEYWNDCTRIAARLVTAYPERVLCVDTYELETEEQQAEIADFLGVDGHHVTDCHKGKREHR